MSNPSNLYAEKIFAEQPTALWSLSESVDYLSRVSEVQRNLTTWTLTNCVASNVSQAPGAPFPDSYISKLTATVTPSLFTTIEASKSILTPTSLSPAQKTFSIGLFVYADHPYTSSLEIGYRYTDPLTSQIIEKTQLFSPPNVNQWIHISHTFPNPQLTVDAEIIFRATYSNDITETLYDYYINGLSIGQWSEEFAVTSLGVHQSDTSTLPTKLYEVVQNTATVGIPAKAYGLSENNGYYIADSQNLFAKNTSVPMVYGSDGVTRLFPNPAGPSLILPGNGFLNKSGQYRSYTFETWLRVDSRSTTAKRIFGPLWSTDGIYIEGPFIKIKINSEVASHFIGEWFRPILLQLKISNNFASLVINGEEVASIDYLTESLDLPESDEDWLGFFAYDDIPVVELDAIALYAYQVPALLAKRRFAFGQAVESPEGSNRSFGGQLAAIDYRFADYTNNYNYPDIGRWSQGIVENLSVESNSLQAPPYTLPQIVLSNATESSWYAAQQSAQIPGAEPLVTFNNFNGYFLFDKFSLYKQDIKAVYCVFSLNSFLSTEQILIKIENRSTSSYFQVSVLGESLLYKFKGNSGLEETLYATSGITYGNYVFAGINIEQLGNYFGESVKEFFGNINQLSMYVAGQTDFTKTFTGNIYSVGFCSANNFAKIMGIFDGTDVFMLQEANAGDQYFGNDPAIWSAILDGGFVDSFYNDEILSHRASYTLIPKVVFGEVTLDIAIDSYWEDYVPLSYFAQYVQDGFGNYYYDLDFIQFNVGYPSPEIFDGAFYNTDNSRIKTYVSFQYLSTGANAKLSYFTNTERAPKAGFIEPGSNWMTTKYEVVNGTIIYPPSGVDHNALAIVTHIEFGIDGIIDEPIEVKTLQYASQAFNEKTANPIGTKFGLPIYPYAQYVAYTDYKTRVPYRIYKNSTPHLYLTKDSGVELLADYDTRLTKGLLVPVNLTAAPQYKVIGLQMFMRSNKDAFVTTPVQLFEIQGTDDYLRIYIQANDFTGQRARIYAINARTGATENGVAFYVNGRLVREPVVSIGEWFALGIAFARPLNFNEYTGAIRITGQMLVDNISYYESSALQEIQRQSKRSWFGMQDTYPTWLQVLTTPVGSTYTWNEVLVISSTSFFGIDPSNIYDAYTGTNKIIIDDYAQLVVGSTYDYEVVTDIAWKSTVTTPV